MTSNTSTGLIVHAEASVLSKLIHKGFFKVPWHQRYYDWKKEHVAELLQDLDEAYREQRTCYFLGAIMLVKESERVWEINDGQQRMVTFSLICSRLLRAFSDGTDTRLEAYALRILFDLNENHTRTLSDADDLTPRLSPPRNDKSRYNLLIRGKDISPNGNLTEAWSEINAHFLSMDASKAKGFFDFIINRLEIACLYVPRELEPSSVFETLNARGKPLSGLDLIRNHFYSFFSGEDMRTRRETVHDNLESVRSQLPAESRSAEYLRCFLQCKYGFLRKDRFYREMKAKIKADCGGLLAQGSADYVFDLVEECARKERVELFRVISAPSENDHLIEHFTKDATKSRSRRRSKNISPRNLFAFLCDLKAYTITQPIVFALLLHYMRQTDGRKKAPIARLVHERLELLTSFVMRTAFVATKFEPSQFESAFSALAQQIMAVESVDSVPFAKVLIESDEHGVFDDSVFVDKMKHAMIRQTTKARRFLLGLAYFQQPDSIVINERRYTVEHVLPRSETHLSGWPEFDGDEHLDYVSRIGNLTLLGNADNRPGSADNRSFSRKKAIYENSVILLTREIAQAMAWSPEEIEKRQDRLARLAAEVWRLPEV